MRPIRFGIQLRDSDPRELVTSAVRAEALGFDVVVVADHVGPGGAAPLVALAGVAQATERVRIGTMVLNNDMRNPVQLAWEAATLDRLSGGRFELGLGAGHTPQEYAATGIPFDPPAVRKARLAEAVPILRRLLDGETVTYAGEHYTLEGARIDRAVQERLPILVGGNGRALLAAAGATADIVGLQGLGRTLPDGHRHTVRWDPARLDEQVAQVRAGAGARSADVELSALVQVADVTDDRERVLAELTERVEGLPIEHARTVPYVLVGTVEEITRQVLDARERWGITYFVVRELDAFAPVVAAVREATAPNSATP